MAKWDVDKLTCQKCKERSSEAADWRSQSDEVQEAVAAALREAAEAVRSQHGDPDNENGIALAEAAILALIPEDAQAALDRVVAEVLTQAADAVEDYCSDAPDLAGHGHSGAIRDVITAIRKGGE